MNNEFDLGWLVGFFEGEGGFSIARGTTSMMVQCFISQTNIKTLEKTHQILTNFGIKSTIPQNSGNSMHLSISSKDMLKFISLVEGKLKHPIKQKEFEIFKEMCIFRKKNLWKSRVKFPEIEKEEDVIFKKWKNREKNTLQDYRRCHGI